jgi:hypothetical protein
MASPSTSITWAPSCCSPPAIPAPPLDEQVAAIARELALGDII